MHDAFGVCRIERVGNLRREVDDAIDLQRPPVDGARQDLPIEHFQREEMLPLVFADLVRSCRCSGD